MPEIRGPRSEARGAGRGWVGLLLLVAVVSLSACRTAAPPGPGPGGIVLEGMASWYGPEFAGRPTANGEIFDPQTMTAAHRTLPFGTIVDVTNLKTGRTARVRINDRGPFVGNRIIDLSYAAARSIGMVEDGVTQVRLDIVRMGRGDREPPQPYSVDVASEPTQAVPEIPPSAPARPAPEPVRTTDEMPARVEEATVESEPIADAEIEPPPAQSAVPPPTRAMQSQPTPSQPAPQPAARGWRLQVGAFGVEDNARRLARELDGRFDGVYVENVSGLYRVRIGSFATRVEAIEMSERVNASGYEAIVLSPDAR